MVACEQAKAVLSAYLDQELDPAQASAVAAHLQECTFCRAHLEELRLTARLLAGLAAPPLPHDLAPAVVLRAAVPRWREQWAGLRELAVPGLVVLRQELGRAAAVVALFVLTAGGPRVCRELIVSWPVGVARLTSTQVSHLNAGLAYVRSRLEEPPAAQVHESGQLPLSRLG